MSIDRLSAQNVSRTYVQNADSTAASARPEKAHQHQSHAASGDSVTLSDGAKSLANARNAVQTAPDVRSDKVADIKQRVDDGTYAVSSRVLARKMLGQQSPQQ